MNNAENSTDKRTITIATRASALAMIQAKQAASAIEKLGFSVRFLQVSTKGDRNTSSPLSAIGGNGLFAKELEEKLLSCEADIAVHSGKDLPARLAQGLDIGAVLCAADCRDCLVTNKNTKASDISVIGTSSARRKAQGQLLFLNAEFKDIRGNVDTRLKKLSDGQYDGIILAKAGLDRLCPNLDGFDVVVLPTDKFIPAACQGIIAVQFNKADTEISDILSKINHEATMNRFKAERYMLSILDADCSKPLGVHAVTDGKTIEITAMFCQKQAKQSGHYVSYKQICEQLRDELLV